MFGTGLAHLKLPALSSVQVHASFNLEHCVALRGEALDVLPMVEFSLFHVNPKVERE